MGYSIYLTPHNIPVEGNPSVLLSINTFPDPDPANIAATWSTPLNLVQFTPDPSPHIMLGGGMRARDVVVDGTDVYFTVTPDFGSGTPGDITLTIRDASGQAFHTDSGDPHLAHPAEYTDDIERSIYSLGAGLENLCLQARLLALKAGGPKGTAFLRQLQGALRLYESILADVAGRISSATPGPALAAWTKHMNERAKLLVDHVNASAASLGLGWRGERDGQPFAGSDEHLHIDPAATILLSTAGDNVVVPSGTHIHP